MWQMLEMIASGSMPREAYPMVVIMTVFSALIVGAALLLLGSVAKWVLGYSETLATAVVWCAKGVSSYTSKAFLWATAKAAISNEESSDAEQEVESQPDSAVETNDGYEGLRLVPSYLRRTPDGFLSPEEYQAIGEGETA